MHDLLQKHLHISKIFTTFAAKIQIDKRLIVVFLLKTQLFCMQHSLRTIGRVPFDLGVLKSFFIDHQHITDKARLLVSNGQIIRLKKGLYILSEDYSDKKYNRFLIANHLYGPSYVSMQTALRYYGLIPEQVYAVQSVTSKVSRSFDTPIGQFYYTHCSAEWLSLGVQIQNEEDVSYLIATPEKALFDLAQFTSGISMRYQCEVAEWLENDLRFDMEAIPTLNIDLLKQLAALSHKHTTLETIIKFIENEQSI
jgi:hypothetical protein